MLNFKMNIAFFLMVDLMLVNAKVIRERFLATSINCGMNTNENQFFSSIRISGHEYSKQNDGLNVVVYDIGKATVVQSKSFADPNTREFMQFIRNIMPGRLIIGTSQILCSETSAVDFQKQQSILYGLRRLRIHTRGLKPLVFRSALFAFCKEECYPNITSNVQLPYNQVHDFRQGPILLSFQIEREVIEDEKKNFSPPSRRSAKRAELDDQQSSHATLYIIIIACALLIVATIIGVAIVLYRRYKKDHGKLDLTSANTQESFRERLGNTKRRSCELLFLAKEKSGCYKQRYEPTTSARLFSIHSNDGGEQSCTEVGDMNGFASYVKVETEDHQLIYKIPSGVSKHDAPQHPPPTLRRPPTVNSLNKSNTAMNNSNEYLNPYDYAESGLRNTQHRSVYQEVEPPGYFEEYTSLEPRDDDVIDNDVMQDGDRSSLVLNEPIYDNYQNNYIVPYS
ncbi:uncharacterized protein [Clytia hemisphaerica]|uniref:Cnidarian restricted protein n=1 Tax=Clytia hemisphaerica TaxID=252671 RepID=A0A7M5USA4_9CNID